MLKILLLSSLLAAAAWSQTATPAPQPPACLSGPVVQGSVTLTCTAMDNSVFASLGSGGDLGLAYMLQVRIASTDPEVIAVRIGVTTIAQTTGDPKQPLTSNTRWVLVPKSGNSFGYAINLPIYFDPLGGPQPQPVVITGIQVQELKASSSQNF